MGAAGQWLVGTDSRSTGEVPCNQRGNSPGPSSAGLVGQGPHSTGRNQCTGAGGSGWGGRCGRGLLPTNMKVFQHLEWPYLCTCYDQP